MFCPRWDEDPSCATGPVMHQICQNVTRGGQTLYPSHEKQGIIRLLQTGGEEQIQEFSLRFWGFSDP